MTNDSLAAFRQKVQVDPGLFRRLQEARAAATVAVAREAGYSFSVEELMAAVRDASVELSDEQLEAVAGGLIKIPFAVLGSDEVRKETQ